jgi:aspartate dehydrogenase
MSNKMHSLALIGFGAIGQALYTRLAGYARVRVTQVLVREEKLKAVQAQLRPESQAVSDAQRIQADCVIECAGHSALAAHVKPLLERGIPCATLSIGALADDDLRNALQAAAAQGHTQLHLLAGAMGGIDAISAARHAGLQRITYTGRKPPLAWRGTPAEQQFDLQALADKAQSAIIFESSARQAAQQFPKNANVAATIAFAGLGLDATQVRLIADGAQSENMHEVELEGAFGKMKLEMRNQPLPENPKTSLLTVLSALRFVEQRVQELSI